jgi:starch-binding outer membrane protein, SusD/RagB family
MKNKINLFILLMGMTMFLTNCSDSFLDHPITGSVSDANIGEILANDPSQIESFLGGAYRSFSAINLYGRQLEVALGAMAHEVDLDYIADPGRNEFAQNNMTSVNSYISLYYENYYNVISQVNLTLDLIDHMDMSQLSNEDADMIKDYKGEALFLRALTNFDLLRLFGEKGPAFGGPYPSNKDAKGIILMLSTATADNAIIGRSTVEECYNAILDDLKSADENIGDNQIPANTTPRTDGSPDNDYTKNVGWAQKPAVAALMGKVYLYMNEYDKAKTEFDKIINDSRFYLDRPVNFTDYIQHSDNNPETIFGLQFYDYNGPADSYHGAPLHQINKIFTDVPGAWKNYFVDQRTAARFGNDPRLYEATLYDKTWSNWNGTSAPTWVEADTTVSDFRYYERKTVDFFDASPRESTKNLPIIRLADVYLMYAEIELKLGNVSAATDYVNKVRRRAWGEADYNVAGTKGEDLSTVDLGTIQEERYKELFFENQRWFDLCRWEILDKELQKYPTTRAGMVTYDDQDYYLPIPEDELKKNPLLEQSLGY